MNEIPGSATRFQPNQVNFACHVVFVFASPRVV
ncbi:hypothetical protein Cabther_A1181 [Chloracidobacterium thermophilum B]|uniref:Uncharacterized protein n=1 Tax=Chloracidobacterium thermophilum (strain B) TaxID=981222 RepID=G2LD75_CHLTF|nr:hypothetical protein Cabther_A1181 [Chloracidobacterium thermophilum B]